jgi:polyphenol oxidase
MEVFPFLEPLNSLPGIRAGWIERIPNLTITGNRDAAMKLLRPHHEAAILDFGGPSADWWRAEQVHGMDVQQVPSHSQILASDDLPIVPNCDGLITAEANTVLTIYAADCGVIWLADRRTGAIGLLHSGKKGTAANILRNALEKMATAYGTEPSDVIAVLSPCIRPPDYEVDFAAEIGEQSRNAGIGSFIDSNLNTARDLARFYSYRQEFGSTGRMMAMLVRDTNPPQLQPQ